MILLSHEEISRASSLTARLEVVSSILAIMILTLVPLRTRVYWLFLRSHQGLGLTCLVGVWVHVAHGSAASQDAPYAAILLLGPSLLWVVGSTVWRNRLLTRGVPRAKGFAISASRRLMRIRVEDWRGPRIRPGEYVYLFVPGVSTFRVLQSDPFPAVSSEDGRWVDVFVENRSPFTAKLFERPARDSSEYELRDYHVVLCGPYGKDISLKGFKHVLMVAWGEGRIATFLPYLFSISRQKPKDRPVVNLVWQVHAAGKQC